MSYSKRHYFTQDQVAYILKRYPDISAGELLIEFNERYGTNLISRQIKNKIQQLQISKRKLDVNYGNYTKEMTAWLIANYKKMLIADLVNNFNAHFRVNFTRSAIWHKVYRLVGTDIDRTKEYAPRLRWTKEMLDFLRTNYEKYPYTKLTNLINSEFNIKTTPSSVEHKVNRLGLKKSKEAISRMAKSKNSTKYWFLPGHVSKLRAPIGYERVDRHGFIWVKEKDPDVFESKHRIIYKQHYGEIEEGINIVFLNGNKNDFRIENLVPLTNSELAIFNGTRIKVNGIDEIGQIKLAITKARSLIFKKYEKGTKK